MRNNLGHWQLLWVSSHSLSSVVTVFVPLRSQDATSGFPLPQGTPPCQHLLCSDLTGTDWQHITHTHGPSQQTNSSSAKQKFLAFHGIWMFITVFTTARHLFLSWAISIQLTPLHNISWRLVLIFSSHLRLGLPSCLFLSDLSIRTYYAPLLPPPHPSFVHHSKDTARLRNRPLTHNNSWYFFRNVSVLMTEVLWNATLCRSLSSPRRFE